MSGRDNFLCDVPWTRQPQSPVGINRAHPYGSRVVYANRLGPQLFDSVRGVSGVTAQAITGRVSTRRGVAIDFDGTDDYVTTTLTAHATLRTYIVIVRRDGDGGSSFGRVFDKLTAGSTVEVLLNDSSNNGFQYLRAFSSANGTWTWPRGSVGDVQIVGVTFDASSSSNNPRAWVNGVEQTVTEQTAPVGTANTNSDAYVLGNRATDFGRAWDGTIQDFIVLDAIVDPATMSSLTVNPWQLFAPLQRRIFLAGIAGSSTDLVIAEALHAHAADNLTLTQLHVLTVADASHAHTVDNVTLTQAHTLAIAEALHAHAAENVVLSPAGTLEVADALHGHAADNLALTQAHNITIADAAHAHTADNIALTQAHVLAIADALHAHTADNVTLSSAGTTLAIAEALHAHAADNLALTQLHILVINDALHAHLADALTLSLPDNGSVVLHGRVLLVRGEERTLVIVSENRTITVH